MDASQGARVAVGRESGKLEDAGQVTGAEWGNEGWELESSQIHFEMFMQREQRKKHMWFEKMSQII